MDEKELEERLQNIESQEKFRKFFNEFTMFAKLHGYKASEFEFDYETNVGSFKFKDEEQGSLLYFNGTNWVHK